MKMNSLSNLLAHEIIDLYSAEEQIIEALPKMIEKVQNPQLKKALQEQWRCSAGLRGPVAVSGCCARRATANWLRAQYSMRA